MAVIDLHIATFLRLKLLLQIVVKKETPEEKTLNVSMIVALGSYSSTS